MIPGDVDSASPHRPCRQFHTPRNLLHCQCQAALSNSYLTACVPSGEAVCKILMMAFVVTLSHERQTRQLLNHPDPFMIHSLFQCFPIGLKLPGWATSKPEETHWFVELICKND